MWLLAVNESTIRFREEAKYGEMNKNNIINR